MTSKLFRRMTVGMLGTCVLLAGGCDSYMDPSVVGRWENTPTKVPILTHLAPIEDDESEYVEISQITAADLLPETESYHIGAADILELTIYDLIERGRPELLPRVVDQNGYIEIPQLGRIYVATLTEPQVANAIKAKMADLVAEPLVSVVVQQRRTQTYHLTGTLENPGPYVIPTSDYRLLQALIAAGGIPDWIKEVYVIRQIPLTAEAAGLRPEDPTDFTTPRGPIEAGNQQNNTGEDLIDLIDELSAPAVVSADGALAALPNEYAAAEDGPDPLIDLLPPAETGQQHRASTRVATPDDSMGGDTRWVFRDGKWIRVKKSPKTYRGARAPSIDPLAEAAGLMTQRIIRVDTGPLMRGDARYNIVVRPGDVIRVPASPAGNVYIDGQVARPGVYQLPQIGRLTLSRAITAAGGLGPVAIPHRVDVTRMVGHDEQATIMLDLRAIREGTQPDVYLKPDDQINIGTDFWATPLAILRGGLRTNYGFGFLLDRNFGNDVFGAPPSNIR